MGRTGSGKSSLVNALLHLYEYQQGEILFNRENNICKKDINLFELR